MPAVDFWDHPSGPPSAAPSVDGVTSSAPRVVLVPVDDSDHAQRAVAWATQELLRGGDGGDVAHLLHVVPAVHASTAMAYGGPPVWMEDLSTFSQSLYAVTIPSDPRHAPRYEYPPHFFWLFSRTPASWLFIVGDKRADRRSPHRRRLAALPRVHGHPRSDVLTADRSQRAGEARRGSPRRGGFHREAFRPSARANTRQARRRRHPRGYQQLERRRDRLQPREDASRVVRGHGAARQGAREGVLRRERV